MWSSSCQIIKNPDREILRWGYWRSLLRSWDYEIEAIEDHEAIVKHEIKHEILALGTTTTKPTSKQIILIELGFYDTIFLIVNGT